MYFSSCSIVHYDYMNVASYKKSSWSNNTEQITFLGIPLVSPSSYGECECP